MPLRLAAEEGYLSICKLFLKTIRNKNPTILLDTERRRSIYFWQFQAAHNGHFLRFFVQEYCNIVQKVAKNDHCVSKLHLLAF